MADAKSPGWYTAPDGDGQQWWNGVSWSESRRNARAAAAPMLAKATGPLGGDRPDPYAAQQAFTQATTGPVQALNRNRNATIGMVLGIIAVFAINVLGPVAIVFGALGLRDAARLRLSGAASTGGVQAVLGLVGGIVAVVILIVQIVFFVIALAGSVAVDVAASLLGLGVFAWLIGD